jgi:hypothetical protein
VPVSVTGSLPPLPGGALSSARPVTSMTITTAATATPMMMIRTVFERHDEAEQLLRDAVALCERVDARAFLAMARQDLAELLLPSPEGRRLLEQARAAANELGMPDLTKRAVAAYE